LFCTACGKKIPSPATTCECGTAPSAVAPGARNWTRMALRTVAVLMLAATAAAIAVNSGVVISPAAVAPQQQLGGFTIRPPAPKIVGTVHRRSPEGNSFERFYGNFRTAVGRRDRAALKQLMAERFEWAADGYTTRDQALMNIGQIFGWDSFWQSAASATAQNARPCKPPYCMNRPGFETSARTPVPLEIMFEQDAAGQWHWTAVLGD
jgi:hypothetical protein